ncbi:MAG: hypothetical protein M1817_000180 [Caeruleum heppii]|nr:MAG: hypothetical protein M1817_000180 [Caeruleum heppii]
MNLLHCPSEPLIDFIFVHGLGGGSRKTWSKTASVSHFWPQQWLPTDPAFENVRVHSFGYDSDWLKGGQNCLDIHHFGKSLLGELATSPHLNTVDTPIVFLGHSMGGLVIKKAYLQARQDATYDLLTKRIHSIYFLATPHRGSDSAKVLHNILQFAFSSRLYVTDLKRGSIAIQSINDEFRNYSLDINLWSFYETQSLKMGVFSTRIVDPDSAVLGYRGEKQIPMHADHRSICKFETLTDPNYILLRNALASTVSAISELRLKSNETLRHSQLKDLAKYLRVSEKPEDDLTAVEDARMSDTCQWLLAKKSYIQWSNFATKVPRVLWLNGKPAAGKSVLTGYAIGQLQQRKADCSYFFFRHGNKSKLRLSACLRSLAFQMACTDIHVRETLSEIQKNGTMLDYDNEVTVWRRLFLSGIFHAKFPEHFWIIDALDECVDFASFFGSLLAKLPESIPLRILITSRDTFQLEKHFSSLGILQFSSENISAADTFPDIKHFVETKAKSLLLKSAAHRTALIEKILGKSSGSFLWTALVLGELSNSHSEAEMNEVLDELPRDMGPLYQRTLDSMSHGVRGKSLAKAILIWASTAIRPLNTEELNGALKIDLKDDFPRLEESIVALCGQLVIIDRAGRVQMVHGTATEFLTNSDSDSEFAINKVEAHTRIARACLSYLTGEEMRPPRTCRRGSALRPASPKAQFSLYACESVSYHLARADPFAKDLLILVDSFLKSNILSWIEAVAKTQNVSPLIDGARHLGMYLSSSSAEWSSVGPEKQRIKGWTTDLTRIAAKFSDALITSPSAIYSIIPAFCPSESTVFRTAGPRRRLAIVGLSPAQWDDRLSSISFHGDRATAVCFGDGVLAVGLRSGTVVLYHAVSCQEHNFLAHGESVRFLQFASKSNLMASCGWKMIRVWDLCSGDMTHSFQAPPQVVDLAFDASLLIVATLKNYLVSWDLDREGSRQPERPWNESGKHMNTPSHRAPCVVSISVSHKMLAVAYIGQPIMLWDLAEDSYYGSCGKKQPNGETSTFRITGLVFNPDRNTGLLAASYLDGQLALLDPFDDQELESFRANLQTLTASPDGRLLAGGVGSGTIHVYEFDSLRLLYRVKSFDIYITQLAFSTDGLRLADIRGSLCNVWEPKILPWNSVNVGTSGRSLTSIVDGVASDTEIKISAMVLHQEGGVVFCGKDDGSVAVYEIRSGIQVQTLYRHKVLVRIITCWHRNWIIMSVDISNNIIARRLKKTQTEGWTAEETLFQSRLECGAAIIQALPGEAAGNFILSTRQSDHLWSIDGHLKKTRDCSDRPGVRKWVQHQQSPLHVMCIELGVAVRVYAWSDWSEVASVPLDVDGFGLELKSVIPYMSGLNPRVLLELSERDGSAYTRGLHLLDAADFSTDAKSAKKVDPSTTTVIEETNPTPPEEDVTAPAVSVPLLGPQLAALAHRVSHIIGLSPAGPLVFLDRSSWVCSVDLADLDRVSISYARHFFVPYDWFSGARNVIGAVVRRDVLLARNDDVAVVKAGLDFVETVALEVDGREG